MNQCGRALPNRACAQCARDVPEMYQRCTRDVPEMYWSGLTLTALATLTPDDTRIAPWRSMLSPSDMRHSIWNAIPDSFTDGGGGGGSG